MIQKVQKGQTITASQENQLIDTVNFLATDTFTNTPGRLNQPTRLTPCLFQIRRQEKGYGMLSRPVSGEPAKYDYEEDATAKASVSTAMWMYMGSSVEDMAINVGCEDIYLLIDEEHRGVGGKITDLWFQSKSPDKSLSGYYDGWIDLQYQSDSDVYGVFVQKRSVSAVDVSSEVSGHTEISTEVIPLSSGTIFCISPTDSIDAISAELQYYIDEEEKEKDGKGGQSGGGQNNNNNNNELSTYYKVKDFVVIGKKNSSSPLTYSQMHTGALKGVGGGLMEGAGCFEIDYDEDEWINKYWYAGGIMIGVDDKEQLTPPSKCADCIVALAYSTGNGLTLETYSDLGEYNAAVMENNYTGFAPLYKMDENGNVECDFRKMPIMDVWSLK